MITFGFNPLHCGAVVASRTRRRARREARHVSIPFIAGQWSLPIGFDNEYITSSKFQSPSLRGSGRFATTAVWRAWQEAAFQSPSLRGSGRFALGYTQCLNPNNTFQSPSLRGSGRFGNFLSTLPLHPAKFQSPSLRGSGRFQKK